MIKTTLTVSGMTCGMCEAHINDAIRKAFPIRKVTSSRKKGETVILSETSLNMEKLRQTVNATGYTVLSVNEAPQQKESLFSTIFRKK